MGFATASICLFRPTDAGVMLVVVVVFAGLVPLRAPLGWLRRAGIAAAGTIGAALPLSALAGLHLTIYGWHLGGYIEQSDLIGFEWRLIPLRWVTVFVSSRPLFSDDPSMSEIFPWIVPGVAGMVACLVVSRGKARLRHALVIGAVILHCLTYLAYRDLNPQGLVLFGNYHYFKWIVPVLGLYAVFLVTPVRNGWLAKPAWAADLAAAVTLFGWRAQWQKLASAYADDPPE
jgi:hypothetical protein